MSRVRLHLTFPAHLSSEPILHRVAADFRLVTNVRRANLDEERGGWVIVEVDGAEDDVARVVSWLADQGLQVDRIDP